jgi:hypothetical protein
MRITSTILAAMIAIAGMISVAEAAKSKAKPGKCGTGMFYDKKKKDCASKM